MPVPAVPPTETLKREFVAIQQRRPSAARSTAMQIVDLVAIEAIRQLTERGILGASQTYGSNASPPDQRGHEDSRER